MHRCDMLDVFLRSLPSSYVLHTSKKLTYYIPGPSIVIHFADGTEVEADVFIGADGIHSVARHSMYARAHQNECPPGPEGDLPWHGCSRCKAAVPKWTGIHAYRCLIPTTKLYRKNRQHTTKSIGSVLCVSSRHWSRVPHLYRTLTPYSIQGKERYSRTPCLLSDGSPCNTPLAHHHIPNIRRHASQFRRSL